MDLEGAAPSSQICTQRLPIYVLGVRPSVPSVCVSLPLSGLKSGTISGISILGLVTFMV